MKLEKLSLGSIKNVLSRAEMKNIMAGTNNPACNGSSGSSDWYCCGSAGSGQGTYIGNTTCDSASSQCQGGEITNNVSRC